MIYNIIKFLYVLHGKNWYRERLSLHQNDICAGSARRSMAVVFHLDGSQPLTYTLVGSSMLNSSMRLVRSSNSGSTTSK